MNNKALVVIDIQNDITKHYRDIIGNINAAIEWAEAERLRLEKIGNACGSMQVVYIKHIMRPPLGDGYKAGGIGGIKTHPLVPKDIVVRGFIIDSETGKLEEIV